MGVFLTATIALMAYMVRTMFNINSAVALLKQRVDGLETREMHRWRGDFGQIRMKLVATIVGLGLLLITIWGGLGLWTMSNEQRRHDACIQRRDLYDGQFVYTRFLGKQLHASKSQIDAAIRELKVVVGPRPECG